MGIELCVFMNLHFSSLILEERQGSKAEFSKAYVFNDQGCVSQNHRNPKYSRVQKLRIT